ncbi:hypothetical protein FISHEDRAFT_55931 [Fistulina hepatica ATCC 64428]|uniref:Uncharacterized protein n=1 Tax=Fistulina hepatica ATCC 64428 TaxID=1128425 RepID=A0A0D7AKM5_9AGAR|nr:hypothetical protein FISHEDRAFT_55931 [Fistulina hepatica ATCC 64428]
MSTSPHVLFRNRESAPHSKVDHIVIDDSDDEDDPLFAPSARKFAGNVRASRYRATHPAIARPAVPFYFNGEIFQSITAIPGLRSQSFEELRVDCYLQSMIATGARPKPVELLTNRGTVIPPTFAPFHEDIAFMGDAIMMDVGDTVMAPYPAMLESAASLAAPELSGDSQSSARSSFNPSHAVTSTYIPGMQRPSAAGI